jgi:hypothetical protein
MRLFIIGIIIGVFSNNVIGQESFSTEKADSSNIYFQSLKIISDAYVQNGYEKIFVEENLITRGLPEKCQGLAIKYVNSVAINKLTRKGKTLSLHRFIPLRLKGGEFFVNIIRFEVSRNKKNYKYVNKGGNKLIFEYDCDKECLIYRPQGIK